MDKTQKHPSAPQPDSVGSNHPSREQQVEQIMQHLVAEGLFAPDEAAEITFSDATFIHIPTNSNQEKQNSKQKEV